MVSEVTLSRVNKLCAYSPAEALKGSYHSSQCDGSSVAKKNLRESLSKLIARMIGKYAHSNIAEILIKRPGDGKAWHISFLVFVPCVA